MSVHDDVQLFRAGRGVYDHRCVAKITRERAKAKGKTYSSYKGRLLTFEEARKLGLQTLDVDA